jgi:hypothetical protein
MSITGRRSGPPDDQALIVREKASQVIALLLVAHADGSKASPWIEKGAPYDPHLYLLPSGRPKRVGKARIHAFAQFVADRSHGAESPTTWRRDLLSWLDQERTISPDKLRRLGTTVGAGWIRPFFEVCYIQHLVVLISKLISNQNYNAAAVVSGFIFRTWTRQDQLQEQLAIVDLFDEQYRRFDRALAKVETDLKFWKEIPARVTVDDVTGDEMRCIFRLVDPADRKYVKSVALGYPTTAATRASAMLLQKLFPEHLNPFDIARLFDTVLRVIGERK